MTSIVQALRRRYSQWMLSPAAKSAKSKKLTYLTPAKLLNLQRRLRSLQARGVSGDFLEFGVALGGSALFIVAEMGPERCFVGYDVFGMIPPPSERDNDDAHCRYEEIASGKSRGIGGDRYYGYEQDLLGRVKALFAEHNIPVDGHRIRLVQGLFENTVPLDHGRPIAFAHIDCDWFDPVALCLERTYRNLSSGGIVVLDDYNDFGGCRKATDAFLSRHPDVHLIDCSSNAVLQRS